MSELLLPRQAEHWIRVHADVLDIARRVKEGDELWRGDPDLELVFNPLSSKFEVIGIDATGEVYVALEAERADVDILRRLAQHDWRHGRNAATIAQDLNRRNRDRIRKDQLECRAERIARLQHDLRKAVGQHYGGLRTTTWGYRGPGKG